MDLDRDRALTLAHEDEMRNGYADPEAVVNRARTYLDFLRGARDAEIISAAHKLSDVIAGSK